MSVFLNAQNELRTAWKLAAFVAILLPVWVGVGFAVQLTTTALFGEVDFLQNIALNVLVSFIPAVTATLFAANIIERLPATAFGLGLHPGWLWNVGFGISVAGYLLAVEMIGALMFGKVQVEWSVAQSSLGRFALTLGMLIVAAAFEELIFRGYPLQALIKGIGPWPAMIAMSLLFGLMHANNPNSSRLGVLNTIVAGMMLSLAYWKTRSLWLGYGLHLGWNVALGMIAGLPLSGLNLASLWTTHISGPAWLLGGEYGPEGGFIGTIIFAAGTAAIWKLRFPKVNHEHRFYKDARAR